MAEHSKNGTGDQTMTIAHPIQSHESEQQQVERKYSVGQEVEALHRGKITYVVTLTDERDPYLIESDTGHKLWAAECDIRLCADAERIAELEVESDTLKRDLAICTDKTGLSTLYKIREALGFNQYYPLSRLEDDARQTVAQRDRLIKECDQLRESITRLALEALIAAVKGREEGVAAGIACAAIVARQKLGPVLDWLLGASAAITALLDKKPTAYDADFEEVANV